MYDNVNPFFSVCMPVTNRGETIFNSLSSVAAQTFRDFELIVVDCGSTDKSRAEIDRFFASPNFTDNPFPYIYQCRDYVPKTVEDWNEPVVLACGKYIAMLEGDDCFLEDHLKTAHSVLSSHENVGMYAVHNQNLVRVSLNGLVLPDAWFKKLLQLGGEIPAPSQVIFVRLNRVGDAFLYNATDYEYAPEMELYVRIALDGFDAYYSNDRSVWRHPSPDKMKTWHYFVDYYTLLEKYGCMVERKQRRTTYTEITDTAVSYAFDSRNWANICKITKNLFFRVGPVRCLAAWWRLFLQRLINKIGRNA